MGGRTLAVIAARQFPERPAKRAAKEKRGDPDGLPSSRTRGQAAIKECGGDQCQSDDRKAEAEDQIAAGGPVFVAHGLGIWADVGWGPAPVLSGLPRDFFKSEKLDRFSWL